jgi:hypothetical protein
LWVLAVLKRFSCKRSELGDERGLADLERVAPQVVAIQFDQIEGIDKDAAVMLAVADALQARHPLVGAGDRLPIDDAGTRAQTAHNGFAIARI